MNTNALGVSRHEASLFRESPSLSLAPGVGTEASLTQPDDQSPAQALALQSARLQPSMPSGNAPAAQASAQSPNWPHYPSNNNNSYTPTSATNNGPPGTQRGPTTAPVLRSYSMPAAPPSHHPFPNTNTGRVAASPSLAIQTPTSPQHPYASAPPAHQLPPAPPMIVSPAQRQAQSLPNVFSGVPPPNPTTPKFPPTSTSANGPHVYTSPPPMQTPRTLPPPLQHQSSAPAPSAFVPAGPPAFTVATPYGTAPMSSTPRPHSGYGVPTSPVAAQPTTTPFGRVSPRKVPPPGSAVALEAGGDSQATLVDAEGFGGKAGTPAPWYSKISKAVTSISKVWSSTEQQQQQQQQQQGQAQGTKYTPPSYYPGYPAQTTAPQYGSGYPPTTPAAYLGMPTPMAGSPTQSQQMSIAIHSPPQPHQHLNGHSHYSTAAHQGQFGPYGHGNANGVGLVKQPVPGMGTYHGFSKVHPGLRHHQSHSQQQMQAPIGQAAQQPPGYGVRMDGPVV
ncbi:hypothetical protein BCR44DRAFT_53133 [Catenaria anguillulae PL171]|uniref:Uncharacterized protein n=1 Tax=Catenaria anguillulae PL171 TaxID=765915 RepID=A0A1Y2HWI7_9FUNG|nr:hypothetical protein BCR44DRAFT_53133 [Catenaria anguillulae PL171]